MNIRILVAIMFSLGSCGLKAAPGYVTRLQSAAEFLAGVADQIPQSIRSKAQCVGIVPSPTNALFSAVSGKSGFVVCQINREWKGPLAVKMGGGGAVWKRKADVLFISMTERGSLSLLQELPEELGRRESSVAGAVGPEASGDFQSQNADVFVWTRADGKFAGAQLGPTTIEADQSTNKQIYNREIKMSFQHSTDIEFPPVPPAAEKLIQLLRSQFGVKIEQ